MVAFSQLDPLLHNQLRLAIVSLLMNVEEADFNYILDKTKASKGNLSAQLTKLKDAGYIKVEKGFRNNYPHTSCSIAKKGMKAFADYVAALQAYINPEKDE